MKTKKEYLGDGVYIRGDGFGVWLKTDRGDVEHMIYLEPDLIKKLVAYMQGEDS